MLNMRNYWMEFCIHTQYTGHVSDLKKEIDPENDFFSNTGDISCCCHSDEQFNHTFKMDEKWSMINNVKEYLNQFTKAFKIIAVSEIWINAETGMDFSTQERGGCVHG